MAAVDELLRRPAWTARDPITGNTNRLAPLPSRLSVSATLPVLAAERPASVAPAGVPPARGGRLVELTAAPVRVTATGAQPLRLARDVLAFDQLDLLLRVLRLEGSGGPTVDIELQTGMQRESEDGWLTAATFGRVSAAGTEVSHSFTGLLRLVRYNVSSLTGAGAAATFCIYGLGRSWA